MTNTAIVYHARLKTDGSHVDCPDGIAAAWVARKIYPDARLIPFDYQQWKAGELPDLTDVAHLVIVDFSFPIATINRWMEAGFSIELIDHHKGSLKDLGLDTEGLAQRALTARSTIVFDASESGATLAWKYFMADAPMPAFLEYVRDRDLWLKQLPMTEELYEAIADGRYAAAFNAEWHGVDRYTALFAYFDSIAPLSQQELIDQLAPLGVAKLEQKRRWVAEVADRAAFRTHQNALAAVVELAADGSEDRLVSDLGNYLCEIGFENGVKFAALKTSSGKWELRSLKGVFECLPIAQQYGGGGHPEACGCHREIEWD